MASAVRMTNNTKISSNFPVGSLQSDHNGLMNIWNISENKIIIPFSYQFSGNYTLNYMWLFIDLDDDLHYLHMAPHIDDPQAVKWQSCLQYLLRSFISAKEILETMCVKFLQLTIIQTIYHNM